MMMLVGSGEVGSTHTQIKVESDVYRLGHTEREREREKEGQARVAGGTEQASRNLVGSRRRRRQRVCVVPSGGDMGLCALLSIFFFSSSFLYSLLTPCPLSSNRGQNTKKRKERKHLTD